LQRKHWHRALRDGVAVAILPVIALAFPATAKAVADFKTPGGAAYCGISHGEPPYSLICWTPNDGFTVSMRVGGRASKKYWRPNRGYHDSVGRTLRFGQRWASIGFRCASRRTGLTCTNRVGHGWWLGRYRGYRLV
jgi:hypothetical protein